jgi:AcrR family transcriptional regulator
VLRAEPEHFSVQRVARRAGFSARTVYGHFASGDELAQAARLSNLHAITSELPGRIDDKADPRIALRQFASQMATAIRQQGSASLLLSRQDATVRLEYRRLLRAPLVHEVTAYLRRQGSDGLLGYSDRATLAELIVTIIESIIINYDAEIALTLDCEEALDRSIDALCAALRISA